MAGTKITLPSPRKKSTANRTSTLTIRKTEITLAEEIGEIVDWLSENNSSLKWEIPLPHVTC